MSLISMHWHTYISGMIMANCKKKKKKKKRKEKNLKYLLIAKVIVPITTGTSRLTAWGPGARLRVPGPHAVRSRGPAPLVGSRGRSHPKLLGFSRFGAPARPFSEGIK